MKAFGITLDFIIIGLVAYAGWHHPAVQHMLKDGVLPFVASLPSELGSPTLPANSSTLILDLNKQYDVVSPATAVTVQRWYNYLLDTDPGIYGAQMKEVDYFRSANEWKNRMILPQILIDSLPHIIACWFRNMLAGWTLYFVTGGLWALWMYVLRADHYYPDRSKMPTWHDMWLQIQVSSSAMVFYTLAPTAGEWMIERGWTYAYQDISLVGGWAWYAGLLVAYMTFVEWGIYWVHRILHISWIYELLHKPHHIYNNRNSLSPFAGLAFDPVDGLMQASPYLLGLLFLPVHFWTHEALLFFTGIWTTNIHDTLVGDTEPIMGSAYHTIHHTTYKSNYGQIFVFFDYIHDTLAPPAHRREQWGWKAPTQRDYSADYAKLETQKKKKL